MFSDGQTLYLSEVLGVDPNAFAVAQPAPLLVLAQPASAEESALLDKILDSVNLGAIERHESLLPPENHGSKHVLVFGGGLSEGTHLLGHTTWWSVPALKEMVGTGPEINARKKATWNLLQALAKELT